MAAQDCASGHKAGACGEPLPSKRRKMVSHGCTPVGIGSVVEPVLVDGLTGSLGSANDATPTVDVQVGRDFLACEFVYVNASSRTIHIVVAHGRGWIATKCSYVPPWAAKPVRLEQLLESGLYSCGTCCGARCPINLD